MITQIGEDQEIDSGEQEVDRGDEEVELEAVGDGDQAGIQVIEEETG